MRPFWSAFRARVGSLQHWFWEWPLWVVVRLLPLMLLVFSLLVAYFTFSAPPSWYFSINARTETFDIELPANLETHWRIEGAMLCHAGELGTRLARQEGQQAARCGSNRWHAYTLGEQAQDGMSTSDQVEIAIGGSQVRGDQVIKVVMEVREDGQLQLSVRGVAGQSVGLVRQLANGGEVRLGSQLNLIWEADKRPRNLVFPFVASKVRVGRDVTWSDSSILRDGKLSVYTGSGESLAKRTLIETVDLLPGDQVRLERHIDPGGASVEPKGFVGFERRGEGPSLLTVTAFGRAESVKVERFGDSGFDFSPGWWVRIIHNKPLIILTTLVLGLISLLSSYAGVVGMDSALPRMKRP